MYKDRATLVLIPLMTLLAAPACAVESKDAGSAEGTGAKVAPPEVVAYLGEEPITRAEVDEQIGAQLMKLRQDEYDLRRRAVEKIVTERLLDREADERGIALVELMKQEVEQKTDAPTEEMLKGAWEQNKNHPSLRGKTYEEIRPLIERSARAQLVEQRRLAYVAELKNAADVRMMLEPPRVAVEFPKGEPSKGQAGAPVTIVEFSDFQCGYCKRTEPTLERLLDEYGDKIHFVYRDYAAAFHPRAEPAAIAARCAGDQDKYWEYHRNLMTINGSLDDADLKKRAADLELDMESFGECYDSGRYREQVQAGLADGNKLGVTGTPTFFINGRMLVGAKPYAEFKEIIDDELSRAGVSTGDSSGS